MVDLPNGRIGRVIAASAAIAVLFGVWVATIGPAIALYDERQRNLINQRLVLARSSMIVSALPELRRKQNLCNPELTDLLISGESDQIAQSLLQERLQTMIARSNINLASLEPLASLKAGPFTRLGLRVHLTADFSQLIRLLAALRSSEPRTFPDDLSLSTIEGKQRGAEPKLDVGLSIFVFRNSVRLGNDK